VEGRAEGLDLLEQVVGQFLPVHTGMAGMS
jgi:hypothetical protein